MVKKGVKAQYSDDKKTVTVWCYPSKKGAGAYKLSKHTWKNSCPLCKKVSHFKTSGKLKFNPKGVPEGELTCDKCGADFCGVSGKDKDNKTRGSLTPATVTPNNTTKVAGSQTKSQQCELSKAEARTKAKSLLKTSTGYKSSLKIPIIDNIHLGDMCNVNLTEFPETTEKELYYSEIKEDIDNQTYDITLQEGKPVYNTKYEGSYLIKDKNGRILNTDSDNPLNAKCSTVNVNIGLKDNSKIGKKIKLKGQELGTVDKIYAWLKIASAGGNGGWKYKKYTNHIVSSEKEDKFGSKSAEKCWKNKTANCVDFAWLMAKLGEGAGKTIGIKKGTYTSTSGKEQGHMWNYYGTKYYDCSSSTGKTPDWKKVESVKKTTTNKKK